MCHKARTEARYKREGSRSNANPASATDEFSIFPVAVVLLIVLASTWHFLFRGTAVASEAPKKAKKAPKTKAAPPSSATSTTAVMSGKRNQLPVVAERKKQRKDGACDVEVVHGGARPDNIKVVRSFVKPAREAVRAIYSHKEGKREVRSSVLVLGTPSTNPCPEALPLLVRSNAVVFCMLAPLAAPCPGRWWR